ncbi:MAG: glycosyltransferase family 4 protein [Dysgonamonadaceae bacterium]|jgi:glycosyltransferase involved in cell wall biosynthesis|nr:glycosyltransferase family 4 protein [Dysgonamonadaceae bacterium]
MNIIFLTTLNPYDINEWSGTVYQMFQALSKEHQVTVIGHTMLAQASYYAVNNFPEKRSFEEYAPVLSRLCSEQIKRAPQCDVIVFGDLYIVPDLEVSIPIVHISDVTFRVFQNYSTPKRSKERIKSGEKMERDAFNKYTSFIYSSEWAKQNAINHYNLNPDKIHVVEFGANIPTPTDYQINIQTDICNLLFIGKNWQKKGGDKVLEAYKKLKSEGFPCTLTIIGSVPNEVNMEEKGLTVIPFLDKSKPEHLSKLSNILKEAHFLVLPTEFDAYGIVFCEASAYAVPSIAANVGGVSQPVCEGKNGYLLPPDATANDYAEKIKSVFNNKEEYLKLRASSRREFETRLNWEVWSKKVNKILEETIEQYKSV